MRSDDPPASPENLFCLAVNAFDDMPPSDRKRRLDLLRQSLDHAKAVKLRSDRLEYMTDVAERLLYVGETERAEALFRECYKEIAALSKNGIYDPEQLCRAVCQSRRVRAI